MKAKNYPDNLFLFNQNNLDFISGKSAHADFSQFGSTWGWRIKAFGYFLLLSSIIVSIAIGIHIIFNGTDSIQQVLRLIPIGLFMSMFMTYAAIQWRRVFQQTDTIIFAEVIRYQKRFLFGSAMKLSFGVQLWYRLITPEGEETERMMIVTQGKLPDGRNLPEIGTPLAVLYVNEKAMTLL